MAFHFERGEGVAVGVHRLLHERLTGSIEHLAECIHPTDPVHAVRKDIKKVRAILTLVRAHLDRKAYRCEMKTLREVSNLLAPVRDTQVHLQTLKDLSAHFKKKRDDNTFAQVTKLLEKECNQAQEAFASTRANHEAMKLLKSANERVSALKIGKEQDAWKVLSEGILETYRCGKKGLLIGHSEGRAEDFHEWRKSVKRLWYQMRLVSPAWPVVIEAINDELGRLGEWLGTDHDLFVLQTIIEEQAESALSLKQREYLFSLIAKRQRELRGEALSLGERIYSEKPGTFCKRVGRYWEAWRGVPERV